MQMSNSKRSSLFGSTVSDKEKGLKYYSLEPSVINRLYSRNQFQMLQARVFVTVSHFHPILIFLGKTGTY
jgi:hypothetical protein